MRLLRLKDGGEFSLVEVVGKNIPCYAVLSHTWESDNEEVTFNDLLNGKGKGKTGYRKIRFCAKQAANDSLQFFWVDTCCIDKSSSAELSEAINSMFRWYRDAARCYVYLSDVSVSTSGDDEFSRWEPAFKKSRWFTRGWTLQELIAPVSVEFFSKEEQRLGDKRSLEQTLYETTGIAIEALRGSPLSRFGVYERMLWAAKRQTKREEDEAYSLLGIFDIHMLPIYGEGRKKALVRLRKEIEESPSLSSQREERKRMLLDSLRFRQIDMRQMTIRNAHTRTCKWLLKTPEYLNWLDTTKLSEHHGFLWIKGKPGTGKSTLMKFAYIDARKTIKNKIVISFFFNARGEDLEKSTVGTYRSLLLQLLEQLPVLEFDSLSLPTSNINKNHQWNIEPLKMLLEQAILSLGGYSVICFIDALDECQEDEIRDMISFFEQVGGLAVSTGIRFQVCFSSRHYPHITIRKGLELVLERQEGHDQDITDYLDSALKIGDSRVAKQIQIELREKASGVFMWVVLVVRILNKEYDRGRMYALQQRLQEIPGDLHELFRDILMRDSSNRDQLVLCIQWVLFASQPLRPDQLYFAILSEAAPDALSEWNPDEATTDVIEKFILDSSKGLAEFTTSSTPKVQFIHESVKDFLLKENGLGSFWPDLGSNFQGQSHERLKNCCLNYMGIYQKSTSFHQLTTDSFPFLKYAVRNVLYHANAAEGGGIAQANFIRSFPLADWIKLDNLFQRHKERRYTDYVSLLYVLAESNMSNLIRVHPSILSCLEVEKERYGPPLFAALATGSKEAVRTFVEAHIVNQFSGSWLHRIYNQDYQDNGSQHMFEGDFKFSKTRTVLSYLAELGDEVIFTVALKTGQFEVDSKDKDGRTSLSWAAEKGHEAVVKLLITEDGVDLNSKDSSGRTPLSRAAENGHEVVVKLLLAEDGVDVNFRNLGQWMPLLCAARRRHKAVVKLLLATEKLDLNCKDSYGQTLLSWAAKAGQEAVVKLLLATEKADLNSKDSHGQTPLLRAAKEGQEAVVKLLLATEKVDLNSKDSRGQTPLSCAAEKGRQAVVKLLLAMEKVDLDSKDSFYGQTPLSWAARGGHEAVAKLLLATEKVDLDSKDSFYGQTPLSWAARGGHEAVVKLLLATENVDLDSKNPFYGQTPLSWAAENGHGAVVKLLLTTEKVSLDSKDSYGQTPLSRAARGGHEAVVKLLLAKDRADVNSRDSSRRTPLSRAAWGGHESVVKLLLAKDGVDVNSKDSYGQTPLSRAARGGHEVVVKLLLAEDGVDVNSKDSSGRTPLLWAAENGHEVVAKLLLAEDGVDPNPKDSRRWMALSPTTAPSIALYTP